jgi:hypothetical protein
MVPLGIALTCSKIIATKLKMGILMGIAYRADYPSIDKINQL